MSRFQEIWTLTFCFRELTDNSVAVFGMLANNLSTGNIIRLWGDQLLNQKVCPFDIGKHNLVVTFDGLAEARCFRQLRWGSPENLLSLSVEVKNQANGIIPLKDCSLLRALEQYGISHDGILYKEFSQRVAEKQEPLEKRQRGDLLHYCQSYVDALEKLLEGIYPQIEKGFKRALFRGQYLLDCARIQQQGIPADSEMLRLIKESLPHIRRKLISEIDQDYGVYVDGSFNYAAFVSYLVKEGIEWEFTGSVYPSVDRDTFKERAMLYPQLEPLRQLRNTLSSFQDFGLQSGNGNRLFYNPAAFSSITGRNQPATGQFIFGLPKWLRRLIKPPEGWGIAYIDYCQQEFGIAAAYGKDFVMQQAYLSGDPYLEMAKQCGAAPFNATKETHREVRERYKLVILATQYGMSALGLSRRLGCMEIEAENLLKQHRKLYSTYWQSITNYKDHAYLNLVAPSFLGWKLHITFETKWRTVQNFPMQAGGADMLRVACYYAHLAGVRICATVHDALLIEAPLDELDQAILDARQAMARASRELLSGFEIRTDVQKVCWPDRFEPEGGREIWDRVMRYMHKD